MKKHFVWLSVERKFQLLNKYLQGRGLGTRLIRFTYEINQLNFSPPQKQETCSISIVIFFN